MRTASGYVRVVSPEEAEHGVAEFWAGGELLGFTRLEDGELVMRIEPRRRAPRSSPTRTGVAEALVRANQLLESY